MQKAGSRKTNLKEGTKREGEGEGEAERAKPSEEARISFGTVGAYDEEDPPVPIPNTVVKLLRADNTWLETAREDKSAPTQAVAAEQPLLHIPP